MGFAQTFTTSHFTGYFGPSAFQRYVARGKEHVTPRAVLEHSTLNLARLEHSNVIVTATSLVEAKVIFLLPPEVKFERTERSVRSERPQDGVFVLFRQPTYY